MSSSAADEEDLDPWYSNPRRVEAAIQTGLIRRLTCQEIQRQYPPEKIAELLKQATRDLKRPYDTWDRESLRFSLSLLEEST